MTNSKSKRMLRLIFLMLLMCLISFPVHAVTIPGGATDIADMVDRIAPAVVNIDTLAYKQYNTGRFRGFGDPFFDVGGGFHPFPQMDVDQAAPWSTTPRYRAKSKA